MLWLDEHPIAEWSLQTGPGTAGRNIHATVAIARVKAATRTAAGTGGCHTRHTVANALSGPLMPTVKLRTVP
jgi:hypothetical protein